ncbi:MAG: hypothetical protein ACK5Q5_03490 [Planctomycetaceae bacterium]
MTSTTTAADTTGPNSRISAGVGLVLTLLTCGAMMAVDGADPDLWGHVQYGREILQDGTLPRTSTWTHTAVGYRWINHENLSELLLAGVANAFGASGLIWTKLLLSLIVISLLLLNRDRLSGGLSPRLTTLAFIAVVAAMGLRVHWHFRPQIVGYTCAAAMWWTLMRGLRRTSGAGSESISIRPGLWGVVPILWVWANSHGSFIAGLCMLWAYLGMIGADLFWQQGRRPSRTMFVLIGVAAAAGAVTLLNPYGYRLHLWLLEALRVPRPEIDDWRPLPLLELDYLSFWVMLLTTGWCGWSSWNLRTSTGPAASQRLHLAEIVVLGLVGYQAVSHVRHLPLLALTWGFLIARPLEEQLNRLRAEASASLIEAHGNLPASPPRRFNPGWLVAMLVWGVYLGATLGPKMTLLRVDRGDYPVDAFAYLARHRLEGRTIVTFNWAQYAIALFADQHLHSTVAFDGRFRTCYPQQVIDNHFDFVIGNDPRVKRFRSPQSPPLDPERALDEDDPELVVLCRQQAHSAAIMQRQQAEWSLLYEDGLAQIWGRRAVFDDPASPRYLPPAERRFTDKVPAGVANWPALPRS